MRRERGEGMRSASFFCQSSSTAGSSRSSHSVWMRAAICASHSMASTTAMLCGRSAGFFSSICMTTVSSFSGMFSSGARWRSGWGLSVMCLVIVVIRSSCQNGQDPVSIS
jgi:hypothetical protein